jgi:pentatricopeptide repeat protein
MARGGRGGGGGGGGVAASDAVEQRKFEQKGSDGRSPTASPTNVPTPARGGRRERENGARGDGRGSASMLEELVRRRGVDEAWNALAEMQRQNQTTDKFTVSRMLMKTVGDGRCRLNPARVYRGIDLVEKFIEMQPKDVDEVLFNALLDTCCRLKDLTRLEATMQRMRDLKVSPSPVTLGILVKTYGQAGDLQKVLQVWTEMEKQRGQANAVTYGCMIDACVKCGHLEKAVEIFKGMRAVGKHRNTILYTTLIKGYGLEKDLPSALALFREMPGEEVPYNTITYNSIIDACIKCGDLATAEQLLREMTAPESQLEPDLITFSTLLKGYCHIGDIDKALQVAEAIKARGLRKDELVYNTLMDGCVKANDITAGVGLFEEMVHQAMRPSAITHSILVRLYQRAGYEEEASEAVAQLYAHHKIDRPQNGDRSKSVGKKGWNQKSPPGSGSRSCQQSPLGSPMAQQVHPGQRGDSSWSMGSWGDAPAVPMLPQLPNFGELSADPSAPSTPMGSPMGSPMAGGGPYMSYGAAPPMPGQGGPVTGTYCTASPTHCMDQHAAPMGSFSMPPGSPQAGCMQPPMVTPTVQGQPVPNLPPWPFGCNGSMHPTMGMCATVQAPQSNDGSVQFAYGNSMPPSMGVWSGQQAADGSMQFACMPHPGMAMPAHGQMMSNDGAMQFACQQQMMSMPSQGASGEQSSEATPRPASGSATPVVPAPWQGKAPDMQGSPFPMPLSPPHDLAHAGFSGNQQQAYFENWTPEGQTGSMPGNGGAQLLGLPASSEGGQGPSCSQ